MVSERTVHRGRESEDAVHHPRKGIHISWSQRVKAILAERT